MSHIYNLSMHSHPTHISFLLAQESHSLLDVLSFFFFAREGYKEGDPISLHLLIPKSKLVSMRNWEECVSLTFFVECICTSCSSNLKQPTAFLIESSPWRLLSGAQVSSKKQHVHMNATNDHMFEGVDPQPVWCDPPSLERKATNHFGQIMGHERCEHVPLISALCKWSTDRVLESNLSCNPPHPTPPPSFPVPPF